MSRECKLWHLQLLPFYSANVLAVVLLVQVVSVQSVVQSGWRCNEIPHPVLIRQPQYPLPYIVF